MVRWLFRTGRLVIPAASAEGSLETGEEAVTVPLPAADSTPRSPSMAQFVQFHGSLGEDPDVFIKQFECFQQYKLGANTSEAKMKASFGLALVGEAAK